MTSLTDPLGKEPSMLASALARPDIIGSVLIGVAFLAAWEWLPGLARRTEVHHSAGKRSLERVSLYDQPRAIAAAYRGHHGVRGGRLRSRRADRHDHRLCARHVVDARGRALTLYPGAADRTEGRVRAAVCDVVRLHGLSENPGCDADRVLSGHGAMSRCGARASIAIRSISPAPSMPARAELFWKIEVPASMPPLFAGLRIAATLAVIGVRGRRAGRRQYRAWLSAGLRRRARPIRRWCSSSSCCSR